MRSRLGALFLVSLACSTQFIVRVPPIPPCTRTAATLSSVDVQAAVTASSIGDIVCLPAGSSPAWTSAVSITTAITVRGAGQAATTINLSHIEAFDLNPPIAGPMRMTGMTITGSIAANTAAINVDGVYASLRFDHLTFTNVNRNSVNDAARIFIIGEQTYFTSKPPIYGLMDHITYTSNIDPCVPFIWQDGSAVDAWSNDDRFGTANALYLEDSTVTYTGATIAPDCDVIDSLAGARTVVRHNTFQNTNQLGHDTSTPDYHRSVRMMEAYTNVFKCVNHSDCGPAPIGWRGGTNLIFDNVIPTGTNGWQNANSAQITRLTSAGVPWDYITGASATGKQLASDFFAHCDAGDFQACGVLTADNGASCVGQGGTGNCQRHPVDAAHIPAGLTLLTNIDGGGAGGYPVRDQTGRGKDSGATQALSPAYWWNNTDSNNGNAQLTVANIGSPESGFILLNRDLYMYTASFNGTVGVGRGVDASKPATCTAGVAYFSTDVGTQGTLFKCTGNAWQAYYTPYPYPHPQNR